MRHRLTFAGAVLATLALTGCATGQAPAGAPAPTAGTTPESTPPPSDVIASGSDDEQARAQAQAWLDDISLPPGTTTASSNVASFYSYTGSPCGPVSELEAFWLVPDATLSDTVPCSPQWLTPRWAELGHFQAGTYEVVMTTCTNAPPPDQCRIDARLPLVVFEPQRFTVPTLTRGIEMILAVCLVIAGARLARSR